MAASGVGLGVLLLLLALVFLGSWPCLLQLARRKPGNTWRHEAHCCLDYVFVYVIVSAIPCIISRIVNSDHEKEKLVTQALTDSASNMNMSSSISSDSLPLSLVGMAMVGGICVMAGNVSLQRAAGMKDGVQLSLGMPLQASMTVSIGTSLNYALQPERSKPLSLFMGVVAFLAAILCSAFASQRMSSLDGDSIEGRIHKRSGFQLEKEDDNDIARNREEQDNDDNGETYDEEEDENYEDSEQTVLVTGILQESRSDRDDKIAGNKQALEVQGHGQLWPKVSDQRFCGNRAISLGILVAGGLALGGFTPCFNISVNDQFNWLDGTGKSPLSVWTANLFFAIGFFASAVILNVWLMYAPPKGSEPSSLQNYFADNGRGRRIAGVAGCINALGNTLQFIGADLAGFATADLVQAYPLVGTVLSFYVLGELRNMDALTTRIVVAMYCFYIFAVVLMIVSIKQ